MHSLLHCYFYYFFIYYYWNIPSLPFCSSILAFTAFLYLCFPLSSFFSHQYGYFLSSVLIAAFALFIIGCLIFKLLVFVYLFAFLIYFCCFIIFRYGKKLSGSLNCKFISILTFLMAHPLLYINFCSYIFIIYIDFFQLPFIVILSSCLFLHSFLSLPASSVIITSPMLTLFLAALATIIFTTHDLYSAQVRGQQADKQVTGWAGITITIITPHHFAH